MANRLKLRGVHNFAVRSVAGAPVRTLVSTHTAVRLTHGEESIYCQNGQFYWEGGEPALPDDVPAWVKTEALKMKGDARKEAGVDLAVGRIDPQFMLEMKKAEAAEAAEEAKKKATEAEKAAEAAQAAVDKAQADLEPDGNTGDDSGETQSEDKKTEEKKEQSPKKTEKDSSKKAAAKE